MKKDIVWNKEYLKSISEESYKKFNSKIIFTNYEMLGIRLPKLRRLAKEIFKTNYKEFLNLNITYYEEAMLYLLVVALIKDIDELMLYFPKALDLIDNWALCDSFCGSLKIVINNKEYFLKVIDKLLKSDKTYNVRVGLVLLLNYYVSEDYLDLIFKYLDNINSDEYYINMAEAWLICEIFIKYQSCGLKYLENNKLNSFTINKTISKIRDSYRVTKKVKDMILEYRRN